MSDDDDIVGCGCVLLVIAGWLVFWAGAIYVVAHFVAKWW